MKIKTMSAAVAAVAFTAFAPSAFASSHTEAPYASKNPEIDNTDVWAWTRNDNLLVAIGFDGLQPAWAAPNWRSFGDDVLYEVHIARGGTSLADAVTYQIRFNTTPYPYNAPEDLVPTPAGGNEFFAQISGGGAFGALGAGPGGGPGGQTYSVTKIVAGQNPVVLTNDARTAPPNVGPRTNAVAYGIPAGTSYETFFTSGATSRIKSLGAGEGRVFAGPRDDPFYVDLGAVFDLAGLRPVLYPGISTPRDSVQFTNVQMIVLEIPRAVANGGAIVNDGTPNTAQTVGVWASASKRKTTILRKDGTNDAHGPWRQVSRMGLPLINEAVIGLQDKDRWNRLRPSDDLAVFGQYFLNPMIVRDAEFAGFYATGAPLNGCIGLNGGSLNNLKTNRFDIIDVINLTNNPTAGAHNITSIGDVIRVDLGITNDAGTAGAFPNGRALPNNAYEVDVTDIELTLLLCGAAGLGAGVDVPDGVDVAGDIVNKGTFPYANAPWEGFSTGVMQGPN